MCVSASLTRAASKHNLSVNMGETYGDNCQKWQHLCPQDGSWMLRMVRQGATRVGLLLLGHVCGRAPGELQDSFRLGGLWGWMLS
ncbi:hypothetical protein CesoFtcFv8_001539 [Champsocephalus esox]|uniref:Uncharacterized protein n=1 Tax=Champsocephalus esox TaxID=159716 RepID=A0AAN8HHK0_9TELE|nr:hypothetical protein CesoFtcFv8_001539 [Champsocephalus esox]